MKTLSLCTGSQKASFYLLWHLLLWCGPLGAHNTPEAFWWLWRCRSCHEDHVWRGTII